ncbi:hypothetical protein BKA70DRAFT_1412056 [Coprinopsis sp. MPI-PUGE-AT-0042]|nr:hypothetical protein BKA70DRAFT_1412056 [Coprinopsis sp. MPI-PUGE-AT-0042]
MVIANRTSLYLDVCKLIVREIEVVGSKRDVASFRLLCEAAAFAGESALFSHVCFSSKWKHYPLHRVLVYRDIITAKPRIAHHTRRLTLYPCHSSDWLLSPEFIDVVRLLSQAPHLNYLIIASRQHSQPVIGERLGDVLLPLARAVRTLHLDNIVGLPFGFFTPFHNLKELDVMGVEMVLNQGVPSALAFRPLLTSFRYAEKASYAYYSNETTDDPLLLSLDFSLLTWFHCRGTEWHRDALAFRDVPQFASASISSLTTDVSGLFRQSYSLWMDLRFPALPRLRKVYLQTRFAHATSFPREDCLEGLCKVINALHPRVNGVLLRLDVVVRADTPADDINEMGWRELDEAVVSLSHRISSLSLETRLLTLPVQGTDREHTTLPFQLHWVFLSRLLRRSHRSPTITIQPTP